MKHQYQFTQKYFVFGDINPIHPDVLRRHKNEYAKKAEVNTLVSSSMKTAIKKFEKEVKAGNKEEASNNLNVALQRVDKAKASGLVHKNKAARLKSRLTKMRNTME